VLADMIEGVIVANELAPPAADRVRTEMWIAVGFEPSPEIEHPTAQVA
jgi:hypothetical protein